MRKSQQTNIHTVWHKRVLGRRRGDLGVLSVNSPPQFNSRLNLNISLTSTPTAIITVMYQSTTMSMSEMDSGKGFKSIDSFSKKHLIILLVGGWGWLSVEPAFLMSLNTSVELQNLVEGDFFSCDKTLCNCRNCNFKIIFIKRVRIHSGKMSTSTKEE